MISLFARALLLVLAASAPLSAAERPLLPAQSEIAFTVKQMGVPVSGRFSLFSARIDLDPTRLDSARAEIRVDTASLATGNEEADTEALAKPWLDAAGFPYATFRAGRVRALGGERYEAQGELTIKGRSRPLTVPFTLATVADGGQVARGSFTLRRTDFAVGGGEWNATDLVADEVELRFRLTLGPPR